MNYQGYENYMQDVLGYQNMPNSIYSTYNNPYNQMNDYYQMPFNNNDNEDLSYMYPETYKMIYPMVCKICNKNVNRRVTKELVEEMTLEIYNNVEDIPSTNQTPNRQELKNGDVRNPNAKEVEVRQETRQDNYLMKDLIKILLLNELRKPSRRLMRSAYRPDMLPMGMPPYMMQGGYY